MSEQKRYIRSHLGLRGIAASLVIAYHLKFGATYRLPFETATAFFTRGYLWVDLFFILSGFIISYTARPAGERFNRPEIVNFFRHRIARIYPLHVFCLLYLVLALGGLAVLQNAAGNQVADPRWSADGAIALVLELLLLHSWGLGPDIEWNIPSWSISAEMFAYLLFPMLIVVSASRAGRWAMMAGSLAFFVFIATTTGNLDTIEGSAPFRCLAGFMIGMLIYRARDRFRALPDGVTTAIQIASAAAIATLLAVPSNDVLLILPFALLVGSTWHDRGVVSRMLSIRPVQWLGELSYSIYLNHVCVIQILWFFWARTVDKADIPAEASRIAWILLVYAATLILSGITYRYVEQPARRYLMRRRPPRAAATAASG